ncbi:hypothetical protein NIES2101_01475 [Calothrix sp. HK-06]|nr:hypothetical protein NIES2101_01475 [Calothrix sp. HK-06]
MYSSNENSQYPSPCVFTVPIVLQIPIQLQPKVSAAPQVCVTQNGYSKQQVAPETTVQKY